MDATLDNYVIWLMPPGKVFVNFHINNRHMQFARLLLVAGKTISGTYFWKRRRSRSRRLGKTVKQWPWASLTPTNHNIAVMRVVITMVSNVGRLTPGAAKAKPSDTLDHLSRWSRWGTPASYSAGVLCHIVCPCVPGPFLPCPWCSVTCGCWCWGHMLMF